MKEYFEEIEVEVISIDLSEDIVTKSGELAEGPDEEITET